MKLVDAIQAAGHEGVQQSEDGTLFIKPSTQQEADFYSRIAHEPYFAAITCKYFGILTEQTVKQDDLLTDNSEINDPENKMRRLQDLTPEELRNRIINSTENIAIVLENLYLGFSQPSVIDIKLGSILWDETASPEKRDRLDLVASTTTSGAHGLRIAGMSLWDPVSQTRVSYDKQFGRQVKPDQLIEAFAELFKYVPTMDQKRELARQIYEEVDFIHDILSDYEVQMRSTSILIVFEGDPQASMKQDLESSQVSGEEDREEVEEEKGGSDDDIPKENKNVKVKLIDFAHSKFTPGEGPDKNVLDGLVKLRRAFRILKNEETY